MKLSTAPSKLVGIQAASVTADMLHANGVQLEVVFAHIRDDGGLIGSFTRDRNWGDKVVLALQALVEALEEESISEVFAAPEEGSSEVAETPEEPPQF